MTQYETRIAQWRATAERLREPLPAPATAPLPIAEIEEQIATLKQEIREAEARLASMCARRLSMIAELFSEPKYAFIPAESLTVGPWVQGIDWLERRVAGGRYDRAAVSWAGTDGQGAWWAILAPWPDGRDPADAGDEWIDGRVRADDCVCTGEVCSHMLAALETAKAIAEEEWEKLRGDVRLNLLIRPE